MYKFGLIAACVLAVSIVDVAVAQEQTGRVGGRVGIGTDITGGIAFGAQLDYTQFQGVNAFEMGIMLFGGSFEEESDNGANTYTETTDVFVVGAIANYLFGYNKESGGPYFVTGVGVGAISVSWEEQSDTDTSLGTPLANGGSSQSEDGTVGGLVINFGIGKRLNERADIRAQVPTFFISGGDERDGATVPTFTVTFGYAFQ